MSSVLREFQKAPPPQKTGYRRQWSAYDPVANILPRWIYIEEPQNQREIMMVILNEIDNGDIKSQEVKIPHFLTWNLSFEKWVPQSDQENLNGKDIYMAYLRRVYGSSPSLTVQVKKQLHDYKTYLSSHNFIEA